MIKQKRNQKLIFSDQGSSVSTLKGLANSKESLELIIHHKIRPSQIHYLPIFLVLIMTISMLLILQFIYSKRPLIKDTRTEFQTSIITIDNFSWAVWANIYGVYSIDQFRVAKRGLFDVHSAQNLFNISDVSVTIAYPMYTTVAKYFFLTYKMIDRNIRDRKFPSQFNFDNYKNMEGVTYFYHSNNNGTDGYHFTKKVLPLSVMARVYDSFYRGRADFNFSDPEQFKPIGLDRMKAIQEEYMRKNLYGDISVMYYDLSK